MVVGLGFGDAVIRHPCGHALEHEPAQPRVPGHCRVEVEQDAAGRERIVNRAVQLGLGAEVVNVVQRQRGDDGIGGGQRVEEAAHVEADPVAEAGQPAAPLVEHVRVDVEQRDPHTG